MKSKLKLKINGESPRSILLALVLASFNYDIYIFDFFSNNDSINNDQIFSFTNFSKNLLSKFDMWKEFEEISYSFNSLKFRDNLVSDQLLLNTQNISENYPNTFGWIAKYSDFKSILINKLNNLDNVHFISKNELCDESQIFDFEFNFNSYEEYPLSVFKTQDKQTIMFNVYLRGNFEKRLYEINTTDGLLILTPINKNLYQIIWNDAPIQLKERSHYSKSFFLDNLTILLPNELKVDQIIGDINSLDVDNSSLYLIKNKSIYFNENKFKSNTLYDFKFDIIINIVIQINNFLKNNLPKNINILYKLVFYYLFRIYLEFKIKFSFINSLINIFTINNIFYLFLRKLFFNLFKRLNSLKSLFVRNLVYSNLKDLFI